MTLHWKNPADLRLREGILSRTEPPKIETRPKRKTSPALRVSSVYDAVGHRLDALQDAIVFRDVVLQPSPSAAVPQEVTMPEVLPFPSDVQKKQREARSESARYAFQKVQYAIANVGSTDDITKGVRAPDLRHLHAETLIEVDAMTREFGWASVRKPNDLDVYAVPLGHVDAFLKENTPRSENQKAWDEVRPGFWTVLGMAVATLVGVFAVPEVSFFGLILGLVCFMSTINNAEWYSFKDEAANYAVFWTVWLTITLLVSSCLRYLYINGAFS